MSIWNQLKQRWVNLKYQLGERYRFVIQHEETYEEVRRNTMTLGRFLFLLSIPVLSAITITTLLIFFTPIRELIPGYTDVDMREKQADLINKALLLEKKIAEQDSFIKSLTSIAETGANKVKSPNEPVATQQSNTPPEPTNPAPVVTDQQPTLNPNEKWVKRSGKVYQFIKPVEGFLTNRFNPAGNHYAIDLAAPQNASIKAIADGYVFFSDYTTETGHVIGIIHADNFISFYKHNRSLFKKVGSYVFAGEAIATIGNSGENSTGPHLHFELWRNGKPVDPTEYLTFKNY
jgi:murein DD-endopeptidase MepM/ murein hydrolase activator NlpD